MQPYLDALKAMHDLLGALGEKHWRSWIAQDIDEWEVSKSISHHLSAYGGMGSFNDIGFDDVWLGTLFSDLKSACYYFAHHPIGKVDISALKLSMGTLGFELSGWRCLACGYGVVSHRDVEYFIARRIIRKQVLCEAEHARLQKWVASVIHSRPTDPQLNLEAITKLANRSGLDIRSNNDWLRPCPKCTSNDTAIYRWVLDNSGMHFVPSMDNLPLRKKGPSA